ncbi:MAG: hypothetical protein N3A72_07385 [bacterium]|nr:hypothetical protein [bacterium]
MKKHLMYFIMSLSLVLVTAGLALTNGDFESGLANWIDYSTGSGQATADYGTARTGDFCAKLFMGGISGYAEIAQAESAANIGETWKVEGWCYKTGGTCYFGWYDGPQISVTSGSWTKYTDMITFSSGATKEVDFYLGGMIGATAYLDDVVTSKVIPAINTYGSFDSSGDLAYWLFEKYGDATTAGTLNWVANYNGQTGVAQMSQNAGEKAKITQVFSVPSTGWYTASAKVATDISDPTKQQKVYIYLQELSASTAIIAAGNTIIQPGKGGFGGAGNWREIKISFYTNATFMGVQVVGINPAGSGVSGNLYIDDVWVTPGAPQPSGTVSLVNAEFTSNINNWLLEPYGDAGGAGPGAGTWGWVGSQAGRNGILAGEQSAGQKGKLTQNIDLPHGTHDALCSLWVYSGATSMSDTQKVYLYLYSLNSSNGTTVIESGNAILQPGKWNQGGWRELKFGYAPYTGYNAVQIVGINPTGKPTQYIYFDSVSIQQD